MPPTIRAAASDPITQRQQRFTAPAVDGTPLLPLFTVLPYIQPGARSALADGEEAMTVAWQTHPHVADVAVDFGPTPTYGQVAGVRHTARLSGRGGEVEGRYNWTAEITRLIRRHQRPRDRLPRASAAS